MRYIVKINIIIQNIGKYISGIAILLMMLLIVGDVFLRNVFSMSLTGSVEVIQSVIMPLVVFPALGYAYWSDILPRLTGFISKRPKWFQKTNKIIILLVDTCAFGLLAFFGLLYTITAFQNGDEILINKVFIPSWPIYALVPIGYFLVLWEISSRFIKVYKSFRFKDI